MKYILVFLFLLLFSAVGYASKALFVPGTAVPVQRTLHGFEVRAYIPPCGRVGCQTAGIDIAVSGKKLSEVLEKIPKSFECKGCGKQLELRERTPWKDDSGMRY